MTITQRDRDLGTAYAMKPSSTRTELTSVGRGTPMGELLRRYWHPVGLTGDATDIPRKVRALGEDLILFRDRHGRVGLLHARCCHRGTTLYYGKVEEDGIRCCYHGWKFDTEGRCLEQPCEPDGGLFKDKVRQPWYPVQERYGLIFAYMGPAEKRPVLPRYECLENMDDGEFVEADDSSIGGGGPVVIPCNWLQHFENVADPYHVPVLHGSFSGPQFTNMMASMPEVKFEMSPRGVAVRSIRRQDDGKVFYRVTEAALPTLRVVPNPRVAQFARVESIGWTLPIDDTSFSHLRRRPGQERRRYRADALEVQRQVLVGHDRARAPAIPRRLRGPGRPGAGDDPFGRAFRPERPRHPDDPPDAL
ncbi:Rieske 2Fe-2S domain-containing protein [Bradyrhizobium elkanii]|nr:Rieske 2Fe-2S domain-containing protein [Bradyrhizobium elkanii]